MIEMRQTTDADLTTIYSWYTEPGVSEQAACAVASDYASFAEHYTALVRSRKTRCYIVRHKGESIGLAEVRGITYRDGGLEGEAVLWLGRKRGVGIGIYLIGWILELAFVEIGLDRLWWWVARSNGSMVAICMKLGFREFVPQTSTAASTRYFEITASDYARARGHPVFRKGGEHCGRRKR